MPAAFDAGGLQGSSEPLEVLSESSGAPNGVANTGPESW
jgi:hypothetical protein